MSLETASAAREYQHKLVEIRKFMVEHGYTDQYNINKVISSFDKIIENEVNRSRKVHGSVINLLQT